MRHSYYFEPTFTLNGMLIIVLRMSSHPGNRCQWKAKAGTAAAHLAVARSQNIGNGISGLLMKKRGRCVKQLPLEFYIKEMDKMVKKEFGTASDGVKATLYTLTNGQGAEISVSDFGALLVSVKVPDKEGNKRDVVLGYDNIEQYLQGTCFFGAVIGRSGNRIANASFSLNGATYQLSANENENNLHSNPDGYEQRLWEVTEVSDQSITLHIVSPDLDQGFPGKLDLSVTYTLTGDNAVELHYEGSCDKDTIVNMTNHSYFNLDGQDSGATVEDQILTIHADYYTPVLDSKSIPTGEIASVAGTPMDFTSAKAIGRDIGADFEQLNFTGGFDHNYVLNRKDGIEEMAVAYSKKTGICMRAYTDCVGVQFYAGNFVGEQKGKDGAQYQNRSGFCLESQFYPNAVNTPEFSSPVLKAGEKYDTTTIYKFEVIE